MAEPLDPAWLRERPLAYVPARSARPGGRRRLLGLARADARRGRAPDARDGCGACTRRPTARCVRRGTRPSASSTTSGSQRRRRRRGCGGGGDRARRPARRLRPGRPRPRCARHRGGVPRSGRDAARDAAWRVGVAPHSVRACPADWLEEIGRYAAAEGLPLHVHADEQPGRSRSASPSTACRPIELLARPAASARTRRSCTPPTPTAPSSTCSPRPGHGLRLPDDRGRPR